MKSNRDFLDGVYSKAKEIENNKQIISKKWRINYRFASIAALIILIPTIFFWSNSQVYKDLTPPMMVRNVDNPESYYLEADYMVIGQTTEILPSVYVKDDNYIYTDISFQVEEVLKGELGEEDIIIRIAGGKVKAEKVKSEIETSFILGDTSLVFLLKDEESVYKLINSTAKFEKVDETTYIDYMENIYELGNIKDKLKMEE